MTGRRTRGAVAVVGMLAVVMATGSQALATFPGENGRLAFEREREGKTFQFQVFTMNPDGSEQTQLTPADAADSGADWSPDGRRIAHNVMSDWTAGGGPSIFAMNADGTCRTQVTSSDYGPFPDFDPAWSPDGRRIAFRRHTRAERVGDIFVVNADATGLTRLTSAGAVAGHPSWSPDGQRIAFDLVPARTFPDRNDIMVMNADGSGTTRLASGLSPDWSPDGRRIAYSRGDIRVMNADGTDDRVINPNGSGPVWSPDGAKIAYTRTVGDDSEVFVMNADGTGEMQLTHNAVDDRVTSWQIRPSSPAPSCAPAPAPDTTGPAMTIMRETVRASRRGAVSIRLRCPDGEAAGCAGQLSLRTASRVRVNGKRRRTVRLGTASFRIPAGRTAAVTVRLSRANRRLLGRLRRVRIAADVRAVDQAGNAGTATATLVLRAPRRR